MRKGLVYPMLGPASALMGIFMSLRKKEEQNAYEVIGGAQLSVNRQKYPQLSPAAGHVGHPWLLRRQGRLEVRAKNPKPRT